MYKKCLTSEAIDEGSKFIDDLKKLAVILQYDPASVEQITNTLESINKKYKKMEKSLKKLVKEAPNSVEYGDWPELQKAVENGEKALDYDPLNSIT